MNAYPDLEAARRGRDAALRGDDVQVGRRGVSAREAARPSSRCRPGLDRAPRQDLLRRYGAFVQELEGRFWTGADVGTSAEDMDVISETGAPYIFSRTPEHGGAGDSSVWTALGVEAGLRTTCARLFGGRPRSRDGGSSSREPAASGGALIERLLAAGAERLLQRRGRGVRPALARREACAIARDRPRPRRLRATFSRPALWAACSNAATIPRLRCRAVAGAANNQLGEAEDAERLRARGILYAPGFRDQRRRRGRRSPDRSRSAGRRRGRAPRSWRSAERSSASTHLAESTGISTGFRRAPDLRRNGCRGLRRGLLRACAAWRDR